MSYDLNQTFLGLAAGLPDDVARLKEAGFYKEAIARIDELLAEDWTSTQNGADKTAAPNPTPWGVNSLSAAMIAQREMMRRLPSYYCLTEEQAVARMQQQVKGFTLQELRTLTAAGRVDWRFVEGERRYLDRFDQTLLATDSSFAARRLTPPEDAASARLRREGQARQMKQRGAVSAQIAIRTSIAISNKAFAAAMEKARELGRSSLHLRAWLPLPAACPAQSEIRLEQFSEPPSFIAPEDALQRTVCWETDLHTNRSFEVQYSYISTAAYADPMSFEPDPVQPDFDTGEQAPHILFTPYLRALAAQLTAGCSTPAQKARRIYDYITLNVRYHYQPGYFVLENISEHCARDRRGDCGIMALTFITLCRIAGIPARWQSGLAVSPERCGCHDWAMFYIAPKGWMYADCSYGASMARVGREDLRLHYFGSLDPGRMVANRAFQAPFEPPMTGFRSDPYDNQTGEIELDGVGLTGSELVSSKQTVLYQELEEPAG